MFYGQRNAKLFSFAERGLSLTSDDVDKIRDIILDISINKDTKLSDRLKELDLRVGPLIKGKRRLYLHNCSHPIDNFEIVDDMGELSLSRIEPKPFKMNPERARFSPGALYDLEEKERESD